MTLSRRGKYWYGEDHSDIRAELKRYSERNGYPIDDFVDIQCQCGHQTFRFLSDDTEGVAIRRCEACLAEHLMGDSEDFVAEAEISLHKCLCNQELFQITAGVHRYRNDGGALSNDVRWLYLGCRCPSCGLVGCYADWKNEYSGYRELLAKM